MIVVEQTIFINGKQVKVIAYFEFESTKRNYLIYCDSNNNTTIYLGSVIERDGTLKIESITPMYQFLLKQFIQELINKDLNTVKGYRYHNHLPELNDNFEYVASQEIVLDEEKKKSLEEFILEINEHNDEILEEAKEEYYLQLVDQKAKERRTIIILLTILIITFSLIAKMILDFMGNL